MNKKRAFVRYTKKGKIVPGSLIVTTEGGYPKDGVYKEVNSDLCCNAGIITTSSMATFPVSGPPSGFGFNLGCNTSDDFLSVSFSRAVNTIQEMVDLLNKYAFYMGVFSVNPDGVNIDLALAPERASFFFKLYWYSCF